MLAMDGILFMIFDGIALVVGGTGYAVILIHCVLHGTHKNLTPFIIIVFPMCLSNITIILLISLIDTLYFIDEYYQQTIDAIDQALMSFLCYTLWSSTWLSLYYQVKIVPSLSPLYTWLKTNFDKVLPLLMVSSLLLCITVGFCSFFDDLQVMDSNSLNISTGPIVKQMAINLYNMQVQMYCVFVSLSILMTFKSVMAILHSLHRHVRNLQRNSNGFRSESAEKHYTAAKTVTSLFVFNLFFFLSQFMGYLDASNVVVSITFISLCVLLTLCPYILIFGNTKLKLEAQRILKCLSFI